MRRVKLFTLAAVAAWSVVMLAQTPAGVTVFEGARVIVGDGRAPIENATFIVTGNRFTAVGRAGQVTVPAGATRVQSTDVCYDDRGLIYLMDRTRGLHILERI